MPGKCCHSLGPGPPQWRDWKKTEPQVPTGTQALLLRRRRGRFHSQAPLNPLAPRLALPSTIGPLAPIPPALVRFRQYSFSSAPHST